MDGFKHIDSRSHYSQNLVYRRQDYPLYELFEPGDPRGDYTCYRSSYIGCVILGSMRLRLQEALDRKRGIAHCKIFLDVRRLVARYDAPCHTNNLSSDTPRHCQFNLHIEQVSITKTHSKAKSESGCCYQQEGVVSKIRHGSAAHCCHSCSVASGTSNAKLTEASYLIILQGSMHWRFMIMASTSEQPHVKASVACCCLFMHNCVEILKPFRSSLDKIEVDSCISDSESMRTEHLEGRVSSVARDSECLR